MHAWCMPDARQRAAGHAPATQGDPSPISMCPAVGGVIAYQKKGSRASLLASGGIAAALLLGAALMAGGTRVPGTLLSLGAPAERGIRALLVQTHTWVVVHYLGQDVATAMSGLSHAVLAMCCAAQQPRWRSHKACAPTACLP